ncbi:MAG TPA: kynureninase [Steroidobacteraceae bacterium]|nr:kynureninase [Steroidobacteraceae bacterium]
MSSVMERARARDAADPLGRLRERFILPVGADGQPLVYLCGHSLGAAPRAARRFVDEELDTWERLGVNGHHAGARPWIDYAELLAKPLAALAGAHEHEVVAMNSLTVNLHLLMASFYRPRGARRRIVIEGGAFPSDRHAVLGQLQWHGLDPAEALVEIAPPAGTDLLDVAQLEHFLATRGEEVALVLWPGVQYLTGQAFDLARIAQAAAACGAACGFDLAHAIGNVPLALHDSGADFAAWCSYKYLNGGPGALAGAFVHERHAHGSLPRLAGWWGHEGETRFRMAPEFHPAFGAAGWQVSNPPIFSTAPLLASLALFTEAGMTALRARSLALTQLLLDELDARHGARLQCVTPRAAAGHGCQLSLRVRAGREAGRALFAALAARGVVLDWREPDILRLAPVPLYNRYADVAYLLQCLESLSA